jgi:hypothetical protein
MVTEGRHRWAGSVRWTTARSRDHSLMQATRGRHAPYSGLQHIPDSGLMRLVARSGEERVWMYRNVLYQIAEGTLVLGHALDVTERITAERELKGSVSRPLVWPAPFQAAIC